MLMYGLGLGLAEIVDGDDGGVIQRGGGARFELEPPEAIRVSGHLRWQQLQRDVTSELRVVREIDLAHAAGTEQRANDIRPDGRARRQGHRGCYCAREALARPNRPPQPRVFVCR